MIPGLTILVDSPYLPLLLAALFTLSVLLVQRIPRWFKDGNT
jgi:hypothetical protein